MNIITWYWIQIHREFVQKANEDGTKVTSQQVRDFLQSQDTYMKTKPKVGKKVYGKTVVDNLGQQLQLDLVNMTEDRKYSNNGYRWILTSIKVLSRYVFTEPSKTKTGANVTDAMEKI